MPSTPTTCPLDCPDACGALAETDAAGALVRVRGNPEHGWSGGTLCGKTALYHELVNGRERLREPCVRDLKGGPLRPVSWDEALERVAERLGALPGADVLALSYGGTMGLVQRKYPLRVFHALGATLHDGGICDAASTAGYATVLGRQVGLDLEEQAEGADAVLIWGADVARTMPHLLPRLQRLGQRGVPLVALDVWRSDTVRRVERLGGRGVILRPGTDALLALTLTRLAFERGDVERAFLERECVGAAEFEAHARGGDHDLARCVRETGVPERDVLALADLLGAARAPLVKVGIGWTRRRNGAMGMRAVCSLAAVLGHAERVHYESADHFGLPEEAVTRPDLGPPEPPRARQVALGGELERGRFGAVVVWSHNPAVTLPDSAAVRRGLAREDLFVVVHDHFVTETAELADVVLPATMFPEHADLYRSYGHRRLQLARPASVPPAAESGQRPRSNVDVFAALGERLGLAREVWDVDAERLIDELLDASRARFAPGELARLRAGEPVKLAPEVHPDRGTPSGRVELVSDAARAAGQPAMATYVPDDAAGDRGRFWLIGAPSVHTHNGTYVHSPRHVAKAWGTGVVRCFLNPDDARELGARTDARVVLRNARGALSVTVATSEDVPRGSLRVDGLPPRSLFPEGLGLNALTSPATSDLGHGNVMYSARVDVEVPGA